MWWHTPPGPATGQHWDLSAPLLALGHRGPYKGQYCSCLLMPPWYDLVDLGHFLGHCLQA